MSEATARKRRPKFLALHKIRQPLPAIVSILHRISGAGLFLFLPFLLYLFDRSVSSSGSFAAYQEMVGNPFVKLLLLGLLWAYLHHFCAGVRFLLLDVHVASDLQPARRTSVAVLVVSLTLTLLSAVMSW